MWSSLQNVKRAKRCRVWPEVPTTVWVTTWAGVASCFCVCVCGGGLCSPAVGHPIIFFMFETLSRETWAILPAKDAAYSMSCTTRASFVGGSVDLMLLSAQGVVLLIASCSTCCAIHNPVRNRSWKCDWLKWLKGSNDQASSGTVKPLADLQYFLFNA